VPAALVRGYRFAADRHNPAAAIVRPVEQDLFR
jgi:F420-0:gamma-glutamyl ligase